MSHVLPSPRPRHAAPAVVLGLLGLAACNSYEAFRVTGYEQAGFSNDADILFIIDNSSSMWEESAELAINFDVFIEKLTASSGGTAGRATLTNAVDAYLHETSGESLYIDFRLALTTSSVDYSEGETTGIDPGESGLFTGTFIGRTEEMPADEFRRQLLCEATCWDGSDLPNDPDHQPGDPIGDQVSVEYLDDVCGTDNWRNHCGVGTEEGLEAAAIALCRTMEDPPDGCFEYHNPESNDPDNVLPTIMSTTDIGTNGDFLREDATTIVVLVTDEGDGSRRIAEGDSDIEPYLDLFQEFPNPVRFAVIGPPYRDSDASCLDGALPYAVERYQGAATETQGMYVDLTDLEDDCAPTDFATNLEQIGGLLSTLITIFPLQAVPDVATIQAWVDGIEIPRAPVTQGSEAEGTAVYGNGWSYDAAYNAVRFNGTAVPDYNSDVRVYYEPLGGMPRELPF